jgi:Domain of unknown function (DUF4129)
MHKFLCILFFVGSSINALLAQDYPSAKTDSVVITSNVLPDTVTETYPINTDEGASDGVDTSLSNNQLVVSPDSIAQWKKDKSFGYMVYLDSLLKSKQQKNKPKEEDLSAGMSWFDKLMASAATKYFFWFLAICFVLFILYRLFLTEGVFKKASRLESVTEQTLQEGLINPDSDFDGLIGQATKAGNFRLAIRYHYLKALQLLASRNIIQPASDKTNYQYVREIKDAKCRNDFARITLSYEYVWYGEFPVDEFLYQRLKNDFTEFYKIN